ncbi:hypothetical protein FH972_021759 [Carpinus fangiana]|uniref:DUF7924 domain-containing protein n=1 Tax=Carpinus fangiana TaxID=176857 RepID=A0A5N6KQA3_9ROSI|nr:hypothetical protein FH972_021759 [Carpinus fangiana]
MPRGRTRRNAYAGGPVERPSTPAREKSSPVPRRPLTRSQTRLNLRRSSRKAAVQAAKDSVSAVLSNKGLHPQKTKPISRPRAKENRVVHRRATKRTRTERDPHLCKLDFSSNLQPQTLQSPILLQGLPPKHTRPHSTTVEPWLESLESQEPPEIPASIHDSYEMASHNASNPVPGTDTTNQNPTADLSTTAAASLEGNQSAKVPQKYRTPNTFRKYLSARTISLKNFKNGDEFARKLALSVQRTAVISPNAKKDIETMLQEYLKLSNDTTSGNDLHKDFNDLRYSISKILPKCDSFAMTTQELEADQRHTNDPDCNEAVLQRTIMMSAIDRSQLAPKFTYDCETMWTDKSAHLLPSLSEAWKRPKSPRPDLLLAFSSETLLGDLPEHTDHIVAEEVLPCIHPDQVPHRSFPFLFMEVKKRNADFEMGLLDGLNAASQALYNIHICMKKAKDTTRFNEIRTFSISINASDVIARVHWAEMTPGGDPGGEISQYRFEEFCPNTKYNNFLLGSIVRDVLSSYASEILFEILRDTYRKLYDMGMARNVQGEAGSVEVAPQAPSQSTTPSTRRRSNENTQGDTNKRPRMDEPDSITGSETDSQNTHQAGSSLDNGVRHLSVVSQSAPHSPG